MRPSAGRGVGGGSILKRSEEYKLAARSSSLFYPMIREKAKLMEIGKRKSGCAEIACHISNDRPPVAARSTANEEEEPISTTSPNAPASTASKSSSNPPDSNSFNPSSSGRRQRFELEPEPKFKSRFVGNRWGQNRPHHSGIAYRDRGDRRGCLCATAAHPFPRKSTCPNAFAAGRRLIIEGSDYTTSATVKLLRTGHFDLTCSIRKLSFIDRIVWPGRTVAPPVLTNDKKLHAAA